MMPSRSKTLLQLVTVIFGSSANGFVSPHSWGTGNSADQQQGRQISSGISSSSSPENNDEILKELTKKYLGDNPTFPTRKTNNGLPSKSDLYDEEELGSLLELHKQISPITQTKKEEPEDLIPSLHDLVLQAVEDVDKEQSSATTTFIDNSPTDYPWLTDDIRQKITHITAIASDVDGTLLSSDHTMHPRTKSAVTKAVESSFSPIGKLQWFFPATGKTRWGALNSMGPEVAAIVSQCPGVFIQGLYCVFGDKVVFEKKLSKAGIEAAEGLAAKFNASVVAYDGDDLYTTELTKYVVDLHELYGEPLSQEIPRIAGHAPGIHKILIMDYDLVKLAEIRPHLEALAKETGACVTQAVPSMLEYLPEGCSKALGVEKLCEVLGIDPSTQLLALGDAENDVGMLEMSAIGVAVGNGSDLAKQAADIVLKETNDEGGAGLAMEVLGGV
jgi:Cof subfamily protein (haloacid dehalogenase superfamily)